MCSTSVLLKNQNKYQKKQETLPKETNAQHVRSLARHICPRARLTLYEIGNTCQKAIKYSNGHNLAVTGPNDKPKSAMES